MAQVKNNLRQPLVVNFQDAEEEGTIKHGSYHFLSKETQKVQDEHLSQVEFKSHIEKGHLVVIRLG